MVQRRSSSIGLKPSCVIACLALSALPAGAQSLLPPCPSEKQATWTNCSGVTTTQDGAKYIGEFQHGLRNGHGVLTLSDGSQYVGEFKDGEAGGQGTYAYADGDVYVGRFKQGNRNGPGTLTHRDGRKETGEWVNGELQTIKTAADASAAFDKRAAVYGAKKIVFPQSAGGDDDLVVCSNGEGEPAIAACARIVGDRSWSAFLRAAALTDRGMLYGVDGQYERAIADFDQAISLGASAGAKASGMAIAYNARGQTYGMMGQYDRAIQDFDAAIGQAPGFAAALFNRGRTFSAKRQYAEALSDFGEAIRLNPDYAAAYQARGEAHGALKQYDAAIEDFSSAIKISPEFVVALDGRGRSYLAKKDYQRAILDFDEAHRLDAGYAAAAYDRDVARNALTCATSLGGATAARRIDACLALIGNSSLDADLRADAYVGRAMAASEDTTDPKASLERMIGDLTDAIRLAPQEVAHVYRLRAMAYYRLQDLDRALSDATSAVEMGGNTALDLALRSQILAARHEPDRAIDDLDAAVRGNPRLADLFILRADARRAKSDKDRALADLETAIRIDPTNAQRAGALAWSRKGDLRYLSDELDLAANSYDEAIRLDPG
ncbi:MAG TPA: tetratricopeptide repeat protein, partial [Roseiarcus sp.]|nr:tetratricopeptide repeat protein [Roseiarcus sp.]